MKGLFILGLVFVLYLICVLGEESETEEGSEDVFILPQNEISQINNEIHSRSEIPNPKLYEVDEELQDKLLNQKSKRINIPLMPEEEYHRDDNQIRASNEHPVVRAYVSDKPKENEPKSEKLSENIPEYLSDKTADRKTVIPVNGNLMYDIKDDPQQETGELKHEISRRFELYPKWFSRRIPPLFGKHFAKRYFNPFGLISNRAHIARHKFHTKTGSRRNFNQQQTGTLPQSWLQLPGTPQNLNHQKNSITSIEAPKNPVEMQRRQMAPANFHQPLPHLANAPGEIVDIPDAEVPHEMDYAMRQISHSLMNHLNPDIYEPYEGHHHHHHNSWYDYDSLPHEHHHRHDSNPCHHQLCLNKGRCHFSHHNRHDFYEDNPYNFKCVCAKGFSGHYCERTPFSCHPNPCKHDGTCTKTVSGFFCSCQQDYKGHNCEIESACLSDPCLNNGHCTETAGGYFCDCEKGFSGRTCSEKVTLCSTNPCVNGGTCKEIEEEEKFECICPKGFGCIDCSCPLSSPASGINTAVSETSSSGTVLHNSCPENLCRNGGTCVKSFSGFSCNCALGFHGIDCGIPDLCTPNPCENNGLCVQDGEENYKCICPYGFKGADCQSTLACAIHPCMNGASCVETAEEYHCKCTAGFKGRKCAELSPCGRNPCLHKSSCLEKGTLYTCSCKHGYRGKNCREKDPCVPSPCINGHCAEINGMTSCNCTTGWMGDTCEVENLCVRNHCLNGATCVHTLDEFKCICPEGFHGSSCELRSPCHGHPCENGAVCEVTGTTFVCSCGTGFHGERCQYSSHCHPSPCLNNGHCFDGDAGYVCECTHGFLGKHCEEHQYCLSDPCLNGGHCMNGDDAFHCKCPLGFSGQLCGENICDHHPCHNGGSCMPANNDAGFACECVFPYHGHNCEDVDPCIPNPCVNYGKCHSHLQRVQDLNYHIGPTFHGADDNVVSVVGPLHNETLHHEPYYDESSHSISYLPDTHMQTNDVEHFHLMKDLPVKAYHEDDDRFHDHVGHYHDDDHYHDNDRYHDNVDFKLHHLEPDTYHHHSEEHYHEEEGQDFRHNVRKSYRPSYDENAFERSMVNHKKTKRSKIRRAHHKLQKRSQVNAVPKVMINVRNASPSKLIKRTLHDLYVCQCADGFLGAHCQHLNPCHTAPCNNGGLCIPRGSTYQCQCINGFGGIHCDDPHPCDPNPCVNNGHCLLTKSMRGYKCECGAGWRGYDCELQDHCTNDNPCGHGGRCVNLNEGIECICRARYAGDLCEVDKCANCDPNAHCQHGHCVCREGFIGNGFRCRVLSDVCIPNPCDNKGLCRPGHDGKIFSCDCPVGFRGARCEFPNPCIQMPCLHNGVCVDSANSKRKGIVLLDRNDYKCFCAQGYRGKDCEETSLAACSSGPCENNGTCFDWSSTSHRKHLSHIDDYECFCAGGYAGRTCEVRHYACYSDPCMNGGTCLDAENLPEVSFDAHGYKCSCRHGFTGRNCEVTLSGPGMCHFEPCLHDGKCVDITNNNDPDLHFDHEHEFKCFCPAKYSGKVCEVPYPACYSSPCLHNGTCLDQMRQSQNTYDETGYHCDCTAGYEGKNCERQYAISAMEELENDMHPEEDLSDLDDSDDLDHAQIVRKTTPKPTKRPSPKPSKISTPGPTEKRPELLLPSGEAKYKPDSIVKPAEIKLLGPGDFSNGVEKLSNTRHNVHVPDRFSKLLANKDKLPLKVQKIIEAYKAIPHYPQPTSPIVVRKFSDSGNRPVILRKLSHPVVVNKIPSIADADVSKIYEILQDRPVESSPRMESKRDTLNLPSIWNRVFNAVYDRIHGDKKLNLHSSVA